MSKDKSFCALVLSVLLAPIPAWADLYSAATATEKKEFDKAFELYRELAEMGQPEAQENLAVMYVNGEGVKRDNVLGYAWASLALANGGGESARGIVSQLAPHLTDAARARVAELESKFGNTALEKSLLPLVRGVGNPPEPPACNIVAAANPDNFYPTEARIQRVSGSSLVEFIIYGDGRAHDPRTVRSFPPDVFTVAARRVALGNRGAPKKVGGVAEPCSLKIRIKFAVVPAPGSSLRDEVGVARKRAMGGDPMSQHVYAVLIENQPELAQKGESAFSWYLKAAQAGIPAAQHVVGEGALSGFGVEQDEAKGLLWLSKAASAGNSQGQLALANYYLRRSPDPAALRAAADWFDKSVAGGNRDARFYFAALLATASDAAFRDPARALELIAQVEDDFGMNPIWSEIRAAAFALSGDFAKAQKEQGTAVRVAKKLGWNTAPQESRLADYNAGTTWSGDLFSFY